MQLQENPPRRLLPKMPSTLSRTANLLSHSEHHRGDPMSLINPEPFCKFIPRNQINQFFSRKIAFLAVINLFPDQKLIFGHF